MKEEDSEEIAQLFERKKWPAFLGDEKFAGWLRGEFFDRKRDRQVPESGELAPDLDAIKREVCSYYGVKPSELMISRRGSFNEARSVAIYLARMLRRDSLTAIGSEFGLSGYSSVSSMLQGIGKQLLKNRELQASHEALKRALIIGQTETCPLFFWRCKILSTGGEECK